MSNKRQGKNRRRPQPSRDVARRSQHPAAQQPPQPLGHYYEERWEGPLPPPRTIERYDELSPGAANIIFKAFDEQASHRMELEKRVVIGSEDRADRGQWIAGGLLAMGVICGLIIALAVAPKWGAAVIVGVLASGAAIYIAGGRPPKQQSDPESR